MKLVFYYYRHRINKANNVLVLNMGKPIKILQIINSLIKIEKN